MTLTHYLDFTFMPRRDAYNLFYKNYPSADMKFSAGIKNANLIGHFKEEPLWLDISIPVQ